MTGHQSMSSYLRSMQVGSLLRIFLHGPYTFVARIILSQYFCCCGEWGISFHHLQLFFDNIKFKKSVVKVHLCTCHYSSLYLKTKVLPLTEK